ncbi:hypothetical protein EU545_03625 [Candidatus Thorarchaeota archaeon]|nr:MAG: hypothetical protein EU545_03625 [Candidatus Thorarchaeota archaeon]
MPHKTLSRKPFMLMLKDDSGELSPVRLDPNLANSENALIVLDEYNDTCWVWVGRNVSMPTRMHALRMGRSLQKSGHQVGSTTIGMATSDLVEILEKNDSDPDVAAAIDQFRNAVSGTWKFDDKYLAYEQKKAEQYEAEPVRIRETATHETTVSAPSPPPAPPRERTAAPERPTVRAETVSPAPKTVTPPPSENLAEKKAAFLLYSAVKNADLIYTERFERDGDMGVKIEAPGTMVVEAVLRGDDLIVEPADFGGGEEAKKIKQEFESWVSKI